jgi:threonine dehydrogenase-like Zn-dependent dehydrogenase
VLHGVVNLRYETVADPAPGTSEVIVQVRACSICGSDLHDFHGKHPRLVFPRILGHEFAGVVVALGAEVAGVTVGTRVCCDIDIAVGIEPGGSASPEAFTKYIREDTARWARIIRDAKIRVE